jgi:glycine hydroxymethyltransferase
MRRSVWRWVPGLDADKIPDLFNYKVVNLPYRDHQILIDEAVQFIESLKPRVVVLGSSLILYPFPVKEVSEVVHGYGGYVVYDGSHVLGLIAGGRFQKPLAEGADILLGSTHKSFFGPQGGIILTNSPELHKALSESTFHKFVDNIHFNRVAALAVALDEMRRNGRLYAERVIENAVELASCLDRLSLKPFKSSSGYTESHQVYLPFNVSEGVRVRDLLEKNRIIVDMAVRLGTAEVSRRGMGLKQMSQISKLIKSALNGEDVSAEARLLASRFRTVRYT